MYGNLLAVGFACLLTARLGFCEIIEVDWEELDVMPPVAVIDARGETELVRPIKIAGLDGLVFPKDRSLSQLPVDEKGCWVLPDLQAA
jgi:hypothetical protein